MKATLIVIQDDADHAKAKALVGKLMQSNDRDDRARMLAQARLIEAYERARWPRRGAALPDVLTYLMDQHGLARADLVPRESAARAGIGGVGRAGVSRRRRRVDPAR